MGGARISSGSDSKQDYKTQADLMEAIVARFGPITFDLAALAENKQSPHYLVPTSNLQQVQGALLGRVWLMMYGVASPDGILVGVRTTLDEAKALVFQHLLASKSEGIEGYVDPLLSFVDSDHLTRDEHAELKRLNDDIFAKYKIEVLSEK